MMLMGPDRKKAVSIIVGSSKPDFVHKSGPSGGEYVLPEGEEGGPGDDDEGKVAAAEKVLAAVDAQDAKGLAAAMQDLVDLCLAAPLDDDADDDEEEA